MVREERWVRARGAGIGLLSAATALAVAELVAGILAVGGPVVSVGSSAIDLAPTWLKTWAVSTFGTADKPVLLGGIVVVAAVAAVILGVIGLRRPRVAYIGLGVFGLLGVVASMSRPDASPGAVLAPALGALAGGFAFRRLRRAALATAPAASAPVPAPDAAPEAADVPASMKPRPKLVATDRRGFLKAAAMVGGVAAVAGIAGRSLGSRGQAAASRAALSLPAPGDPAAPLPPGVDFQIADVDPFVTPNAEFYRIDTSLLTPKVRAEDWRLSIGGMVDHPMDITYAELIARPMIERDITLACVSNEVGGGYIGNARWVGVPLLPLMEEAGVQVGADQMVSRSVDGFTIGTPSDLALDGRDAMLAVQMNGEVLPIDHGFPVRMVIPGLYGYNSAMKWITGIEMTTFDAYDAYWVKRGWAQVAPILTQSRIDTPGSSAERDAGPTVIAGLAWAQHRGISRVEVQIDDGEWMEAQLGEVPSSDTWRQWKYDWDATPGRHTLRVRATDGEGELQTDESTPPFPDGARGWHAVEVNVA